MTTQNAVALVGHEDDAIRPLPVVPTAQKLALALPTLEELKVLQAYGEMFYSSGIFPHVKSWQAAAAIIQYGSALGIDAFTSLKDIHFIMGKPSCDASLINSLIKRDHGGDALLPVEATKDRCTIRFKRRDWDHYEEATVTAEDYDHLIRDPNRPIWKTSRADMLWARNVSQIGRRHFPDTIKGLYTRDELVDAQATEASYRVATPAAEPEPAGPPAATQALGAAARRKLEANALGDAIVEAFGTDKAGAKDIGGDLICFRFGLEKTGDATTEQLAEVRAAVEGWSAEWAPKALAWLRMVGSAATATMATDVAITLEEHGVDDAFIQDALAETVARFELAGYPNGVIDAAVDASVAP